MNDSDNLVARVKAATAHSSVSFAELLQSLNGADPAAVAVALASSGCTVTWERAVPRAMVLDTRLPVPHPLDYDWRFSRQTVEYLAAELSEVGGAVALLGTPSLFLHLAVERAIGDRPWLLDRNVALRHTLPREVLDRILVTDIASDGVPKLEARALVVDPPWYPQATKAFLWAARECSVPGAHVLVSTAPVGTRETVSEERADLLQWAESVGLVLVEQRPGALTYDMPPFERNALRALAILDFVPEAWRKGDLLIFERLREPEVAVRPTSEPSQNGWVERVFDRVRVRIDVSGPDESADPALLSLVPGDVLPTVSRRDPRRAAVRVWTSGNRVFGCRAPSLLLQALDSLPPASLTSAETAAKGAIEALVVMERGEYTRSEDEHAVVDRCRRSLET